MSAGGWCFRRNSLLFDDLRQKLLSVLLVPLGQVLPSADLDPGRRRALPLQVDGHIEVALLAFERALVAAALDDIADNDAIRVVSMDGIISTYAGSYQSSAWARVATRSIEPSTMDSAPRLVR